MTKNRSTATAARTTVPLVVAAGALVLAGAGGAVAGGMITGAQIKDGTVTSADVKNGNLTRGDVAPASRSRFERVQQYEQRNTLTEVPPAADSNMALKCGSGRHILHGSGYWEGSNDAVQVVIFDDSRGARVYARNPNVNQSDFLHLEIICAAVSGNTQEQDQ